MKNDKWINQNVVPFNKFYLGSCYTEAYVPAIAALGVAPEVFVANNFYYFRFENNSLRISTSYVNETGVLLSQYGIVEKNCFEQQHSFVNFVIEQLKSERLCLCRADNPRAVDLETNKLSTGSGKFVIHWLLVYGYDLSNKCFYVLEHRTNYSALYRPMIISFDELNRAYNDSFHTDLIDEKNITLLWKTEDRKNVMDYSFLLREREQKRHVFANDSIGNLSSFYHFLQGNMIQYDASRLLIMLNEIIAAMKTEEFVLKHYNLEQYFVDFYKYNNLLRSYTIKNMMGKDTSSITYVQYCEKIEELLKIFKELYDEILSN